MTKGWAELVAYRDFHDVPRSFVLTWRGRALLFDCPFDRDADDYADAFDVFELPRELEGHLPHDWRSLRERSVARLGQVQVAALEFDPTRRRWLRIGEAVLAAFG